MNGSGNRIACPKCGHLIDVEEAVAHSIRHQIESETAARYDARAKELAELERVLAEQKKTLHEEVEARVTELRQKTAEEERAKIRHEYESSIAAQTKENKDLADKLKEAREAQTQLEQLKRSQELAEAEHKLALERARNEAAREAETRATEKAAGAYLMTIAEKEKQIEDFRRQVSEWKQKAEQGSMQLQGEIQELVLEDLLRERFPGDRVTEVPKGVRGADCILEVTSAGGTAVGTIIYESKRTKNFTTGWLEKLRDDQRSAKADLAVLVSAALPPQIQGTSGIAEIDGIWVCSFDLVATISAALRYALLQVDRVRETQKNSVDKATMLYEYLTGQEFRLQFSAVLESLLAMKNTIEDERRAFEKRWKEREKQVDRAARALAGMWGSIGGIAGGALPEMPELRLIGDGGGVG